MHPLSPMAPLLAPHVLSSRSCPSDSPLSCHNSTPVADTCCFIPPGQLLQTQFWDTDPPTGPSDSWTIHGLWPDNCDGSYPAQCDSSRAYDNISDVLTASSASEAAATLAYMRQYWKDYKGDDEHLWQHEWAKHGTCISTLDPGCYGADYRVADEAVAYFARAVGLFKALPTHAWLAAAGITPSAERRYARDRVQDALRRRHGVPVTLGCRAGALNQVWYHFNVRGSLQDGDFVPAAPDGPKGSCPDSFRYLPKSDDGGDDE